MNEEIKNLWIEALESDEYLQARETLRNNDEGYCCLGVLCHLKDSNCWYSSTFVSDSDGLQYLPPVVQQWAGLNVSDPQVTINVDGESVTTTLSRLNDEHKYSFAQIAAIIREQL